MLELLVFLELVNLLEKEIQSGVRKNKVNKKKENYIYLCNKIHEKRI
jgi:hypothetical protein